MKLKTILVMAALLLTLLSHNRLAGAISLEFDPSAASLEVGDTIDVDVLVTDPAGTFVGGYDLFVTFDDSVLGFNAATSGGNLGPNSIFFAQPGAGQASVVEVSLAPDLSLFQDGVSDFVLFTLSFDALGVGLTNLAFLPNVQSPSRPLGFLIDEAGDLIEAVAATTASVEVTQADGIFLPPTLTLVLLGLAGVVATRRR